MHIASEMTNGEVRLRFSEDRAFALCDGEAIYPSQLFADLVRAEQCFPSTNGDVLITCKGRYEFSVALLSAWLSGNNVILSPSLHQASLDRIRKIHPIIAELGDGFIKAEDVSLKSDDRGFFELRFCKMQQALTMYTSGSSGKPQPVQKSISDIFTEAFALKEALIWPNMPLIASVPPHHLYGLTFSILLPWVLGIPMVNECPLHAEEVVEAINHVNAGILITVPIHLRALLKQEIDCKPLMAISSAGVLDGDIAMQWQKIFDREIIEIYGSSETGVIAHRQQLNNKSWLAFSEVHIENSKDGLLQVSSPFINSSEGEVFQTQDIVTIQGESQFILHGRADSIVKIAGKRISLLTVEAAIKGCKGVLDVAVMAVPVQGHIRDMAIWAAVAIGEERGVNARSIRMQLLPLLDGIKIPRRIVMLKQLPREKNGKLRKEQLMSVFQNGVKA
ncbi:MAG: AMP-binding protein [Mariprofundaceae bacterium]|nr:AMP-binding protein [Mariprofundaceae bacterium]